MFQKGYCLNGLIGSMVVALMDGLLQGELSYRGCCPTGVVVLQG